MNRNELPTEIKQKYLEKLNMDLQTLKDLAIYFANARESVSLVKITDVDLYGFDLGYAELTTDGLVPKEIRIQFNRRIETESDIIKNFKELVKEAKSVLGMKPDKSYVPPGRPSSEIILFTPPSTIEFLLVCFFWVILYTLQFSTLGPVGKIIEVIAGSREAFQNTILAIGTVNIALAIAILGVGVYTEFPVEPLVQWVFLTLFFGFLSARRMIRVAYKYKAKRDADDIIG